MMKKLILTTTAVTMAFGATCFGQAATVAAKQEAKKLVVGDKAPDIDIQYWVKGVEMDPRGNFTPVTSFKKGNVYVLEFWATWCGPCIASMPHMSEMQEKYKDYNVQFIGVSDETLPKVTNFLFQTNKQDGKMNNDRARYTLTTDPDGSVKNDFFRAAGQTGIPCAFIIGKEGHVEWIGHPMRMDEPLDKVVRDTWDRDAYASEFAAAEMAKKKQRENAGKLRTFMAEEAWADATLLGWDNAMTLNQVAWTIVDNKDVKNRDYDVAMKAATRANELTKGEDAAILDTLARVYYEMGDLKNAVAYQKKAVEHAPDNQMGTDIKAVLKKYMKELAGDI